MTTQTKPLNAHQVWKTSDNYAIWTVSHSGGYDSGNVIGSDGQSHSAYWYLLPKPGKQFKNPLREGEKHAGVKGHQNGGKPFATFEDAAAWAKERLGITGWKYNAKGIYLADNSQPMPEVCSEIVSGDWSIRVCGKPAKRNGLCGRHATASEKREANHIAWKTKWNAEQEADARSRENERSAADYVARLAGYGIKSSIAYDKSRTCHGQVALQGEKAIAIVEELLLLRRELGIPEDDPIGGLG